MRTFRLRIVIPVVLVLATAAVAVFQTSNRLAHSRADVLRHGEHTFRTMMAQLQEGISDQMLEGDLATVRRLVALAALDLDVRAILLSDDGHGVLAGSRSEWQGEAADAVSRYDRALAASISENYGSRLVVRPETGDIDGYFAVALGPREGELRPSRVGTVYAQYDLSRLLSGASAEVYWDAARICAVFLAVALGLALVLHLFVTRPVERLAATVGAVAAGDASARSGLRGRGEIARLAESFDAMADRLAANQEALRQKTEEVNRYFALAPDLLCIIGMDGVFHRLNQAWETILGHSAQTSEGRRFLEFLHPDDVEATTRTLQDLRAGKAFVEQTNRFRHRDGSYRWLEWRGMPQGDLVYATARDTTERRRLEEQLRRSQKLEAVGRLAGGVAHDFNNLLTAILGDAQLLAEGLHESDPLREEAQEIQAAAQKAAALTRQLLAFGRKETAQPKVLDLGEIVRAMDRILRRLIGEDVELVTESDPALGLVRVDPGQIEQVILNLAVNARDAMPEGGRLTIETANAQLGEDDVHRHIEAQPGPYVMLAVSDTGCGMSPEVRSHLFEPFFTTKALGRGTGLGLSTVYGIVKQCSGDIWVYSEPGRGSVFKIFLPRVEGTAEALEPSLAAGQKVAPGTETVLVVEDEPMVRAMAVRVLRGAGYDVLEAGDGLEALDVVAAAGGRKIELLVADVVMPRLGGLELAERLRPQMPGLRVLFISGYTDRGVSAQGMLGGAAFLSKPFASGSLAQKVREVLDQRSDLAGTG